ncbi:hypothetical protein Ddye_002593 [Dipteronia dyeriana]|uniref:KIB1-4 beta-propeller domain-containing protein n=1 Tax=Dipteronia dyeriana TaxID=168575 RepID=A0AAD9XQP3_9ROSI|nr:hypothetical protein Ddye_002593 [Dipteronia dyeriana]
MAKADVLEDIDVLEEIARRIKLPEDFVAFSGVCSSWRSAASKENFRFRSSLVPWLMLPPKQQGTIFAVSLASQNACLVRIIYQMPMAINVTLPKVGFWSLIKIGACFKTWITIDSGGHGYFDMIYYKGKFYVIDGFGGITAIDIISDNAVVDKQIANLPHKLLAIDFLEKQSAGKLLEVVRNGVQPIGSVSYGTYVFQVLEVDLSTNKWSQFKDLGNRALFLGDNSSFSVEVSDISNIKPNCIYFTDDCQEMYYDLPKGGGKDMGIYNLQDGSIERIEPYFKGRSKCNLYDPVAPPMWVEGTFQ